MKVNWTQMYDNSGYWLDTFDGEWLAMPYGSPNGETMNIRVGSRFYNEARNAGFIPRSTQGSDLCKTNGYKERSHTGW